MTKLVQRVDVTLRSFYMFNSSFSKKEGDEHKKILYYHPADIELNTKIKDVGLSEAIIRFTGTFTAEEGCKALHTLKTTQLFYQPEPDYWMVLVLNVPKEIRIKDGVDVTDYRGGEVQDRIYSAILEQCYKSYRLFHGTFEMNRSESEIEEEAEDERRRAQLRERLKVFFDKLIPSLKFPVCQFNDVTRSIQYLPLDKSLFLRAHNLMSMVRATFPFIEETILLNEEQVVCSGNIDPYDLYSLHEFIVLAKDTPQNSAQSSGSSSSSSNSNDETSTGCFVQINENSKKSLTVYLRIGKKPLQAYQLIVYRATSATMCLLVNDTEQLNVDFYAELQSYIGPQLSGLARDIAAVVQQAASNSNKKSQLPSPTSLIAPGSGAVIIDENSPKYLFVNEQSLKHLSNIPIDKRRSSKIATIQNSLPTNVLNLIVDLSNFGLNDSDVDSDASAEEQCKTIAPEFEEVQIKTTTDFWIVKRRCNWRQYFVIIFNNKATLLDVTQEAKRIFEQELTDAVFFDK